MRKAALPRKDYPEVMERECVVIGIHGLANKPPADDV